MDELVLVDPWWEVCATTPEDEAERSRISMEIEAEVSIVYLYGKTFEVVGLCWGQGRRASQLVVFRR
jgi:hypothetical protein